MYLIPRLIGVSIYSIILLIVCLFISKSNKKNIGKIFFIYTIILTIMAYNFIPSSGNDLYRLFYNVEAYGALNLTGILEVMENTYTPISVFYFYLIGKTGIKNLLPAITTFIFYTNIFYIIKDYSVRHSIKNINISISLFFFMSCGSYFEVISGIRTMLGFSIVCVCIYNEYFKKHTIYRNLIFYLLAGLIHPAALVLVIIRFIVFIFDKSKSKLRKFILNFIFFILMVVMFFLLKEVLLNMTDKIINYVTIENGYSYIWEYIIGFFMLLVIFRIQYFNFHIFKCNYNDIGLINFIKLSKFLTAIVIVAFFVEYNTFHRFIILNSILFLPISMAFLNVNRENMNHVYKLRNFIIFMSVIILILSCMRGNLSSLKFFI